MTINALTSRQLRVFVAVAEQLSFTAAAAQLHLAQSAVSVTVRDVESRLGVKLLDRDTRNVALTPVGAKLLELARRVLDTQAGAAREFASFLDGDAGELVISALPSIAAVTLPAIVSEFTRDNPRVRLHIRDGIAHLVVDDLAKGVADIGITARDHHLTDAMVVEPLVDNPLVAVLPPGHQLVRQDTVSWRQLSAHPFVTIRHGTVQPLIDRAFTTIGVGVSSYIEASSIQSVAGLVAAGLGVSSLPAQSIPLIAFSNVETRPLREPVMFQRLGVVRLREAGLSPLALRFIAHLKERIVVPVPGQPG